MGHRSSDVREIEPVLSPRLRQLSAIGAGEQRQRGYLHTLAEIGQQPETWRVTARALAAEAPRLIAFLRAAGLAPGRGVVILTGSGSSHYVGDSLVLPLQQALRVPVQTVASGSILTHPDQIVPGDQPCLAVSFARSGDSPESCAALDLLLERRPECHHVIITCNGRGRLATSYLDDPRVLHIVLDDRTCDRSLVMTSSFTNMVLAGRMLASLDTPHAPDAYVKAADALADAAAHLLAHDADRIAEVAARSFSSVVFLASAARAGASREASLKLLEMTEGRVRTLAETFLGLRHGPMSTVHGDTLIAGFLSSNPVARAYECDLLRELDRKRLGAGKLIAGSAVPEYSSQRGLRPRRQADSPPRLRRRERISGAFPSAEPARACDLHVEYAADIGHVADDALVLLDVLVAQLLAFFRCLEMGLKPDAPSSDGIINRVVGEFAIHRR
jgi:tagatose-6-phosphate ketose/aldose isomerase